MPRRFNIAGPNDPARHYTLPALRRLPELRELIEDQLYFVVHAPRQVGKTTALLTLARELTEEGHYAAVLVSMETGAPVSHDLVRAEPVLLGSWRESAEARLPPDLQPPPWPDVNPGNRIRAALRVWAEASPRPLVIFLDEIDALSGEMLVSVLRQIRDGYVDRPEHFPQSMCLIGMRDVRDYRFDPTGEGRSHSSSPFNIKSESLILRDFTRDEIEELYAQHTADTGQVFLPEAVDRAFDLTRGQPWLVNALGRQLVQVLVKDRGTPISADHVDRAREILVERQETHLDSLLERLKEERIRAIIEPMLAGTSPAELPRDDIRFAIDLGLVRMTETGGLDVANPIYREVIARELTYPVRAALPSIQPAWLRKDGRLDADRLLDSFLAFWRQHGEALLGAAPYHEIAPHLVLMAFLHRVANGGGRIDREYAIGRGRMDLCLRYGPDVLAFEIKVWRQDGDVDPLNEGLDQLDGYLAGLGLYTGWLLVFDRRPSSPPLAQRLSVSDSLTPAGRRVKVVRL
ncbi:MAG TPA: hypothetical protein VLS89_21040 [Candidatus Nanopelagicales bacterium]|nr:hypothetical protein [Candidatus Nanopelagicales bacterium]